MGLRASVLLRRLRQSLAIDALLAFAAATSLALAGLAPHVSSAVATHPTWDWRHLGSVHSSELDEDYCLETTNAGGLSFSTMATNIRKALWVDAPDDQQWDATGFDSNTWQWRVWFVPQDSIPCQNMSQAQRDPIEIEYWLRNSMPNVSVPDTQYYDEKGHLAARFYYVYLYAPWVAGQQYPTYYRHQVNHESGHTLGMDDGNGTCPDSVMHSSAYGCGTTDRSWPSAGDKSGLDSRTAN